MARPFLLIVDGDPARTPTLLRAMEADGWMVQWAHGSVTPSYAASGMQPDLLLVDPTGPEGQGLDLVKAYRGRNPGLPVLLLTSGDNGRAVDFPVQGFVERTQTDSDITVAVRRFRPEASGKFSSEDLFADLIEDIESAPAKPAPRPAPAPIPAPPPPPPAPVLAAPPAPAPVAAPRPPAQIPLPPIVPSPGAAPTLRPAAPAAARKSDALLGSEDIFGDLLDDLQGAAAAVNQAGASPRPHRSPFDSGPTPALDSAAEEDITLSDISGVNDPFEWAEQRPATPAAPAPAASHDSSPGSVLEEYGNYYLLDKIAVGGMAELFKAQQRGVQGFQKIVAIKRILPHLVDNEDFVTMFIDEAKLAAQLTHPNIVQIFDLGKAGTSYYIAMEYVNGRDLRTLLRRAKEFGVPFPEPVAAFVIMKVASALDYAHRKRGFDDRELKLVHRDVSPQNVLISSEGAVKLVDFGIAKAATKASHTVAGALKGKLLYMSPEQALGQPLDNRSDLYSLGLVLFEMLTGERCFQADSEMGVLEKVRMGRIGDLRALNPSISKDMLDVTGRSLQKHVEHRYPSARLMERDLRELLMKQGHIPTEHEIAEFVEALLLGPKERVENVIASRFPFNTMPLPALASSPMPPDAAPTDPRKVPPKAAPLPTPPPLDFPDMERSGRPGWLVPAIIVVALLLAALIWYFRSS